MSEYIFVHLLDKKPVGSELGRSMPLHMTILHWFESSQPQENIISEAQTALQSISAISAQITERDFFGPNNDIPVMRIARTTELIKLHSTLLLGMQRLGATFNMNWSGVDGWSPHVSDKTEMSLSAGDEICINDVDLAVRSDKLGVRSLLHRFNLE